MQHGAARKSGPRRTPETKLWWEQEAALRGAAAANGARQIPVA